MDHELALELNRIFLERADHYVPVIKNNSDRWIANPSEFFGIADTEVLSEALCRYQSKSKYPYDFAEPFLAISAWKERDALSSKGDAADTRTAQRFREKGSFLAELFIKQPGLVLLVGPSVNRNILSQCKSRSAWHTGWVNSSLLDKSSTYDVLARDLAHYLDVLMNPSNPSINTPVSQRNDRLQSIEPLARLIRSFGAVQQEGLLFHGLKPRMTINECGERYAVSLASTGLGPHLAQHFSSRSALESSIAVLRELHIIQQTTTEEGTWLSCATNAQAYSTEDVVVYLLHIFPQDGQNKPLAELLLKHVKSSIRRTSIPVKLRAELLQAARTHLPRRCFVRHAKGVLKEADDLPNHLRLELYLGISRILQWSGKYEAADEFAVNALKGVDSTNVREHCLIGLIQLSMVDSSMLRKDYLEATARLGLWEPYNKDEVSYFELELLGRRQCVFMRLYRYTGNFEAAAACFHFIPRSTQQTLDLAHYAATLCELNKAADAERLLRCNLELQKFSDKPRKQRLLLLPLAEALLLQKKFEEASQIFRNLDQMFRSLSEPNITNQLLHVSVVIGLLRIACGHRDWTGATFWVDEAFRLTQTYNSFSSTNFYVGVLWRFCALISCFRQKPNECREALDRAVTFDQKRRYFMTGVGTYVLDDLKTLRATEFGILETQI